MEQAKEEFSHGMRIYNYLNDRGVKAVYSSLPTPPNEFESVLDVFEKALAHEKLVTKSIHNLADIAYEVKDHATISFFNWFIDEQVEEEATFETHINYISSEIPKRIIPNITKRIIIYCFLVNISLKNIRDNNTEKIPCAAIIGAAIIALPAIAKT